MDRLGRLVFLTPSLVFLCNGLKTEPRSGVPFQKLGGEFVWFKFFAS